MEKERRVKEEEGKMQGIRENQSNKLVKVENVSTDFFFLACPFSLRSLSVLKRRNSGEATTLVRPCFGAAAASDTGSSRLCMFSLQQSLKNITIIIHQE